MNASSINGNSSEKAQFTIEKMMQKNTDRLAAFVQSHQKACDLVEIKFWVLTRTEWVAKKATTATATYLIRL
jgi:arginine utilization protein RocB